MVDSPQKHIGSNILVFGFCRRRYVAGKGFIAHFLWRLTKPFCNNDGIPFICSSAYTYFVLRQPSGIVAVFILWPVSKHDAIIGLIKPYKNGQMRAAFPSACCGNCPYREQCPTHKGTATGQNVLWVQSRRIEFLKALHLPEGLGKLCPKPGDSVRKRAGISSP